MSEVLQYGYREDIITDSKKDRAKLQIALYMLMAKHQNPNMIFESGKIAYIPDKYELYANETGMYVNTDVYIGMIEDYLKSKMPNEYEQLKKNSPNLFNKSHYKGGKVSEDQIKKLATGGNPSEYYQSLMNRLQEITLSDPGTDSDAEKDPAIKANRRRRRAEAAKIVDQLIDIKKVTENIDARGWEDDLSAMSKWLGTSQDVANPYVQLYYQMVDNGKAKAEKEFMELEGQFDSHMQDLWEYQKSDVAMGLSNLTPIYKDNLRNINYKKYYSFAYKKDTKPDGKEFQRLVTEKDKEFTSLDPTQQNVLRFLNRVYRQWLGDKNGFANQKFIEKMDRNGKEVKMSRLELFNGIGLVNEKHKDNQFKHYAGFFPKVPPTLAEVRNYSHPFSKKYWKEWYKRSFTFFFESQFEA